MNKSKLSSDKIKCPICDTDMELIESEFFRDIKWSKFKCPNCKLSFTDETENNK